MENITIENVDYKNYHFTYAEYFGYKILINKDDGYINITKLLKSVNCKTQWKNIKRYDYYIKYYNFVKEKVESSKTSPALLDYKIKGNQYNNHISGVYIHPKLLNYILIQVNPEYSWFVSEVMDKLNNNQYEEVKTLVDNLKSENEKLKKDIEESKPRLIPVQTNELSTNQIIRIYKINDNEYKLSYDQNKKLKYELIGEFIFNCASNISKSEGLKQFYINNSTRTFNKDKLNDVIKYLETAQ